MESLRTRIKRSYKSRKKKTEIRRRKGKKGRKRKLKLGTSAGKREGGGEVANRMGNHQVSNRETEERKEAD